MKKFLTLTFLFVFVITHSSGSQHLFANPASDLRRNNFRLSEITEELQGISTELKGLQDDIQDSLSRLNINRRARGRWLMDGQAGEKIVESAREASGSIIIMARMFDIESGPLMEELAETLVAQANQGTEVLVLLSERFPINYFHEVNQRAAEFFEDTPVQLEKVAPEGRFSRDLTYHPDSSTSHSYVNAAVMLVDGVNLIGGTYILSDEDLKSGQSNILQVWGLEVYRQVWPSIEAVFDPLGIEFSLTEKEAFQALTETRVDWPVIWDFEFHLGVYTPPVLAELYESARHSIRILSHRPTRSTSRVLSAALRPLAENSDQIPVREYFYQESGMSESYLRLPELFRDLDYHVYKFDEAYTQYHRAGLIDGYRLYTGTVELSLIYLQGWNLQSMIVGNSFELGEQLNSWLDERRENAISISEKYDRFSLDAAEGSLTGEQREALTFLQENVKPAIKNNQVRTLVELLSAQSAESIGKRFLLWIHDSDRIEADYYRSTFESLDVDMDSPRVGEIEEPTGRKLLQFVAEELIYNYPPAREIFEENLTSHLQEMVNNQQTPQLVEEKSGYRLHRPDRSAIDEDFEWTFRLEREEETWQIQLVE